MAMSKHKITIVGCGPGSPDYLTPAARQAIQRGEVVVGAERLLNVFANDGRERIPVGADIEKVLSEVAARRGKSVVVLVTGDAGLCSLAQPLIRRFGRDACEIIPGVSSIQVAFARIGVDWHDARIINAHSRDPRVEPASLAGTEKIALLTGREESLRWAADLADVLGGDYAVFVCENLTLADEKVRQMTPADLRALRASSKTIVLLIKKGLL